MVIVIKMLYMLFLAVLLVGCSGQQVVNQNKNEQVKQVDNKKKDMEEITAYANGISPYINKISKNIDDLGKISNIGSETPELLTTEKYTKAVQLVCDDLKNNIRNIKALSVSENKKVIAINKVLMDGINTLEFVPDNFPNAIRNLDVDMINRCNKAMSDSRIYIGIASDRLLEES
jgi:PBP1b-binding outer membrane lipoprotein LpoB